MNLFYFLSEMHIGMHEDSASVWNASLNTSTRVYIQIDIGIIRLLGYS